MKTLRHGSSAVKSLASRRRGRPRHLGVGGPVGSGKTALILQLCRALRDKLSVVVVTNDLYTREDADFLVKNNALEPDRIMGVETGGCPHTAIREDISVNRDAVRELERRFPDLDLVMIESGGDNLAATFSPELVDGFIYIIDVAEGDKIPRKKGLGMIQCDLLLINKEDLAPYVGANLDVMRQDTENVRGKRPFLFTNLRTTKNLDRVITWIRKWMIAPPKRRSWQDSPSPHESHTHT